jgi:hypothetical protein
MTDRIGSFRNMMTVSQMNMPTHGGEAFFWSIELGGSGEEGVGQW